MITLLLKPYGVDFFQRNKMKLPKEEIELGPVEESDIPLANQIVIVCQYLCTVFDDLVGTAGINAANE